MSAFNPYREWLGIQAKGSVTYYQLLGVKRQDSPSVIRKRATRVIRRLQKIDPGSHADERERLVNRVRRAAKCLSSTSERKKYDLRLKQQREKQAAAASKASQRPQPAPGRKSSSKHDPPANDAAAKQKSADNKQAKVAAQSKSAKTPRKRKNQSDTVLSPPAADRSPDSGILSGSSPDSGAPGAGVGPKNVTDELMRLRPRRRDIAPAYKANRRRSRAMKFSLALFGISVLGIGFLILKQSGWGSRLMSSASAVSPTTDPKNGFAGSSSSKPRQSTSTISSSSTDQPDVTDAGSQLAAVNPEDASHDNSSPPNDRIGSSSSTGGAMETGRPTVMPADGNSSSNKKLLSLLQNAKQSLGERKIAKAKATIEQARAFAADALDRAMLERLSTLAGYVETYWQATDSQLAAFTTGNEAVIDGRRVMIVEKTDRRLIIRSAGKNQTIDLQKLSAKQAAKLADSWLDKSAESTKVFRGAMMAVTPGYNKEKARRLWREAEAGGEIHLGDLEQVLDDKYE